MKRTCTFVPLALLCGCTIMQLRQDVSTREHRVELKEEEVRNKEAQRDALRSERERLQANLREREMSRAERQRRLDKLQRENAGIGAYNAEQQDRKRRLDDQVRQYKDELNELNKRSGMTAQEKQKRKEHLNRAIDETVRLNALELGVHW